MFYYGRPLFRASNATYTYTWFRQTVDMEHRLYKLIIKCL